MYPCSMDPFHLPCEATNALCVDRHLANHPGLSARPCFLVDHPIAHHVDHPMLLLALVQYVDHPNDPMLQLAIAHHVENPMLQPALAQRVAPMLQLALAHHLASCTLRTPVELCLPMRQLHRAIAQMQLQKEDLEEEEELDHVSVSKEEE